MEDPVLLSNLPKNDSMNHIQLFIPRNVYKISKIMRKIAKIVQNCSKYNSQIFAGNSDKFAGNFRHCWQSIAGKSHVYCLCALSEASNYQTCLARDADSHYVINYLTFSLSHKPCSTSFMAKRQVSFL